MALLAAAAGCAGTTKELKPAATRAESRTAIAQARGDTTPSIRIYVAELTPLNEGLTKAAATGRVTIIVDDRNGTVKMTADADQLGALAQHPMFIHVLPQGKGGACPTIDADANKDDIIDGSELAAYAGVPLVALNKGNFTNWQEERGVRGISEADVNGRIRYRATESTQQFEEPLWRVEGTAAPRIEKAVIVLYGVDRSANVPTSVHSPTGGPVQMSIPVACGEITRIS